MSKSTLPNIEGIYVYTGESKYSILRYFQQEKPWEVNIVKLDKDYNYIGSEEYTIEKFGLVKNMPNGFISMRIDYENGLAIEIKNGKSRAFWTYEDEGYFKSGHSTKDILEHAQSQLMRV